MDIMVRLDNIKFSSKTTDKILKFHTSFRYTYNLNFGIYDFKFLNTFLGNIHILVEGNYLIKWALTWDIIINLFSKLQVYGYFVFVLDVFCKQTILNVNTILTVDFT